MTGYAVLNTGERFEVGRLNVPTLNPGRRLEVRRADSFVKIDAERFEVPFRRGRG